MPESYEFVNQKQTYIQRACVKGAGYLQSVYQKPPSLLKNSLAPFSEQRSNAERVVLGVLRPVRDPFEAADTSGGDFFNRLVRPYSIS